MSLVMRCGIFKPESPSLGHLFSCAFLHLLQVLQLLLPQPNFPLLFLEAKSLVFGKNVPLPPGQMRGQNLKMLMILFENCSFWRQLSPWQATCFRVRGCLCKNRSPKERWWTLASLFLAACQSSILVDDLLETTSIKSHKNDIPWNSGHFFQVFSMVFPSRKTNGSSLHLGWPGALVTWDVEHVDLDPWPWKESSEIRNDQDSVKRIQLGATTNSWPVAPCIQFSRSQPFQHRLAPRLLRIVGVSKIGNHPINHWKWVFFGVGNWMGKRGPS